MSLLAPRPLRVVVPGTLANGVRHLHVRTFLGDEIEASPAYRGLSEIWGEPTLRSLATDARSALGRFSRGSGIPLDEVGFAIGGRLVGKTVQGRHVLDEPGPPLDRTVNIGAFVQKLLTDGATTDELAELLTAPDRISPGPLHMDLRTPRPLGTVVATVEIDNSEASRALRAPLEELLRRLDAAWGDEAHRRQQAVEFLRSIRFDRWEFLADDLVVRFEAVLFAAIRGGLPRWEVRLGDGRPSPPPIREVEIPAFVPSGDAALDRSRLKKWRERLDEVEGVVEESIGLAVAGNKGTRPVRGNELRGFKRGVGWLYQNLEGRRSLATLAEADLGSRDRWRDVQRTVRRARLLLDLGTENERSI